MSPEAQAQKEKLIALVKGIATKEGDPARQITLIRGVVAVGTELLVELRVEQLANGNVTK